jgi:hypothetical protein
MGNAPGEAANILVPLFYGEELPPPTFFPIATNNQRITTWAADLGYAIRTGNRAREEVAVRELMSWFNDEKRFHMRTEQGAAQPYAELYLRPLAVVVLFSHKRHEKLFEEAIGWLRSWLWFCSVTSVDDRWNVRSPGCRVSSPASFTRDSIYQQVSTGTWLARRPPPHLYDQAAAMFADLLRRGVLGKMQPGEPTRLMFPMHVERYERGFRAWCPNLSSGADGVMTPRAYGFPWSGCAVDEDGREEHVSFMAKWGGSVPEGQERKQAKAWGRRSRLMPRPLPKWDMGALREAFIVGPNGVEQLDTDAPSPPGPPPPPAPPVKPPPAPEPEPVEPSPDTIAGDHTFERLPGGTPQQCRYCYRGRRKHGSLPERVQRRVQDDLGKQPPGA